MIKAQPRTRNHGRTIAFDGASFTVQPGLVTGFLGPDGAVKSTTMRMILGLDTPSSSEVRVKDKLYARRPIL
jgi:ABC-2 type transport system ATP-binding protein